MGYFVKKNSELGVFANTWVGFIVLITPNAYFSAFLMYL